MSRGTTIDEPRAEPSRRFRGWSDDDHEDIDPRLAARRRAIAIDRRRRARRGLVVVAIIVTAVGLLYASSRSALLDIDSIAVQGNSRVDAAAVRQASGLRVGDHLVDVDADRAAEGIRQLAWVKDVTVERSWGGTVAITVTEREPVIVAPVGTDGAMLVDADRRILTIGPAPDGLPVVEGLDRLAPGQYLDATDQGALNVARALSPGLRSRVIAIDATNPQDLILTTRPVGVVHLGTADRIEQKVTSLQAVYAQADLTNLCSVDVRVPDSPVLTRGAPCA